MESYEDMSKLIISNIKKRLNIDENEEDIVLSFETKQDATSGNLVTNTVIKGGHNGEKYEEF